MYITAEYSPRGAVKYKGGIYGNGVHWHGGMSYDVCGGSLNIREVYMVMGFIGMGACHMMYVGGR